ncbi:MAG: carbohydrate ABC transporter permease [Chloroflexota bacterium]|nr:MAG: carbohydrate ABC transporter permease [Chloroflexota bacterium]
MSNSLARALRQFPLHLIVILITLIWSIPTIGLFVSSFRPARSISSSGWWTAFANPSDFSLDLYREALSRTGMAESFVNSLLISIPATMMPIMIAAFAAYAFAWMRFPGRDLLFVAVIGLLVIPLQMTFVPVLRMYNQLALTGKFPGIWLAHAAYGLPFAIYLLRNFIGALPRDLFESAFLDGASNFDTFFYVVMPLSVPSLASLVIFQFMWVWNDLLVALIYVGGTRSVAPMTVTIANQVNSLGGNWQVLTAAAFISMLLPLIVFFALQRYFVRGILAGSVKG